MKSLTTVSQIYVNRQIGFQPIMLKNRNHIVLCREDGHFRQSLICLGSLRISKGNNSQSHLPKCSRVFCQFVRQRYIARRFGGTIESVTEIFHYLSFLVSRPTFTSQRMRRDKEICVSSACQNYIKGVMNCIFLFNFITFFGVHLQCQQDF